MVKAFDKELQWDSYNDTKATKTQFNIAKHYLAQISSKIIFMTLSKFYLPRDPEMCGMCSHLSTEQIRSNKNI